MDFNKFMMIKNEKNPQFIQDMNPLGKALAILSVFLTGAMLVMVVMYAFGKKGVLPFLVPTVSVYWFAQAGMRKMENRDPKIFLLGAIFMALAEAYLVFGI